MVPKVTEAHLEARRQQILDAAMKCFGRKVIVHVPRVMRAV